MTKQEIELLAERITFHHFKELDRREAEDANRAHDLWHEFMAEKREREREEKATPKSSPCTDAVGSTLHLQGNTNALLVTEIGGQIASTRHSHLGRQPSEPINQEGRMAVTPKRERGVSPEHADLIASKREFVCEIVNQEREKFEDEHGQAWHTTDEDLVQAGLIGFLEAASVYRDGRQSLTSFAHPWIRKAVWKALDDGRRIGQPFDFGSLEEEAA